LRLRPVLGHHEVNSSIRVVVAQRAAALFAVNLHATGLAWNRTEVPLAIAGQPQSPAGIITRRFTIHGVEVLSEKDVLVAVAIHVPDAYSESGSELRFDWERSGLK